LRESINGGYTGYNSPVKKGSTLNKIYPRALNQSLDNGLINMHTIGIRP